MGVPREKLLGGLARARSELEYALDHAASEDDPPRDEVQTAIRNALDYIEAAFNPYKWEA